MNHKDILSKESSLVLRGLAILCIMFHNFLHLEIFGFCKENEMSFIEERAEAFFNAFSDDVIMSVFQIVSFLGWIGVPVFVFLTGYGLATKYPPQYVIIHFII